MSCADNRLMGLKILNYWKEITGKCSKRYGAMLTPVQLIEAGVCVVNNLKKEQHYKGGLSNPRLCWVGVLKVTQQLSKVCTLIWNHDGYKCWRVSGERSED
ncbi:hypothetical protein AVEN_127040-1 [Araneus ventricosus]|uniref:Uncharacterized protein n=1 Tax=Araneus ventricosus TaxID=182803 RepID=A0A4Y2D2U6_ARAVE|nr:hypothetical protein AVEN_127040-1 [Araneus ventricosus]